MFQGRLPLKPSRGGLLVVTSSVISGITLVVTLFAVLATLLAATHEPSSNKPLQGSSRICLRLSAGCGTRGAGPPECRV